MGKRQLGSLNVRLDFGTLGFCTALSSEGIP